MIWPIGEAKGEPATIASTQAVNSPNRTGGLDADSDSRQIKGQIKPDYDSAVSVGGRDEDLLNKFINGKEFAFEPLGLSSQDE